MGAGLALRRRIARPRSHPNGGLIMAAVTGSQTIGPFWHLIEHPEWADLTRFGATGTRITLTGFITDGDGNPVTDAAIELWQGDPPAQEHFLGFGRGRPSGGGK